MGNEVNTESLDYRAGFLAGHDSGYHRAAAEYMAMINKILKIIDKNGKKEGDAK